MQTPLPTRAGQTAMPAQLTAPRSAPEAPAGTAAPGGKRGRGAKGADRGTGENGGRGGGGGGGKQETSTQPLAITDKSEGLSGKSVASKDKNTLGKEGDSDTWDLTKVIASLESELGKWSLGRKKCQVSK